MYLLSSAHSPLLCGLSDLNCCVDTKVIHVLLIGSSTNTLCV